MTEKLEEQLEDNLVPCDMYRVCPNYEELCCSSVQFRDACRKKENYYLGEDK